MLKLRKNKKGFTLVELIVVIAIMAVLAGVVAGVTVSQLNKQTDKTNQSQAKTVADFISAKIVEESYDFENDTSLEVFLKKGENDTFTIDDTKGIGKALKEQYGGLISYNGNGDKGKTIGVSFDKANTCFYIVYLGKQGENKGDVKYKVSAEAVVTKVSEGQAIS